MAIHYLIINNNIYLSIYLIILCNSGIFNTKENPFPYFGKIQLILILLNEIIKSLIDL